MSMAVIFPLVTPPFVGKSYSRAFARIDSREIFLRTIEIYAPRNHVTQRLVVVQPDDMQTMQERFSAHLGFQGVTVAGGTSDWFGCVERGLARLDADIELVMIHDPCCPAVPFTLLDAMEDVLAKAKDAAGIVPVLPSRSAFADVESGETSEYVDMSKVSEVQSPQLFRRKPLEAAYAKRADGTFVDDAELVMSIGNKIATVG